MNERIHHEAIKVISRPFKTGHIGLIATVMMMLPVMGAMAQAIESPALIQERSLETERRQRQLESLRRDRPPEEPAVDTEAVTPNIELRPETGPRFRIEAIAFDNSRIFSDQELKALAEPYEQETVTFTDLQRLVLDINRAYAEKGFISAQAFIPPQKIEDGQLRIRLIEGEVGRYNLSGNDSTKPDYILRSLSLEAGDLFELEPLEDDLYWLNRTSDIQVSAQLQPGQEEGQTDINLMVKEPRTHVLEVFSDNAGSSSTGSARLGARFVHRSLFGYRDRFEVSASKSSGATDRTIRYDVPVNRWGGRLGLFWADSDTKIDSGPLADINVGGDSTIYQASFTQPVYVDRHWKVDLTAQLQDRNSDTLVDGDRILSADITSPALGINAERQDELGLWFTSHQFVRAHARARESDYYSKYRLSLARTQLLGEQWSGYFNMAGQYTDDTSIASAEQFQVGGVASVRGYPEGYLIGDVGYYANLEIIRDLPVPHIAHLPERQNWEGFLFVDHGGVYNEELATGDTVDEQITGVGFGLRLRLADHLTANAALAWGLDDHEGQRKPRAHLRISYFPMGY